MDWQTLLLYVIFVGCVGCVVLAILSLRDPKYAFICKVRSKANGFLSWLALAVLLAVATTWVAPKDEYGDVIIPDAPAWSPFSDTAPAEPRQ